MSGNSQKARAAAMDLDPGSHAATIQRMIADGFFDGPVSSQQVARRVSEKSGKRLRTIHVQTYLKKFLRAEILQAVKVDGQKGNFWVLASVSRAIAVNQIGKTKKGIELQEDLFSLGLTRKLKKVCGQELEELRDVFGKHGNCTAFLLRKIWKSF